MDSPRKVSEICGSQFAVPVTFDRNAVPGASLRVELQNLTAVNGDAIGEYRQGSPGGDGKRSAAIGSTGVDILCFICSAEESYRIAVGCAVIGSGAPGTICIADFHKLHPGGRDCIHARDSRCKGICVTPACNRSSFIQNEFRNIG